MAVDEHGTLVLPSCVVDLGRRRVVRDGSTVALTTLEGKLLAYLVAREGEDVSRDELLRAVWGHAATTSSRAVDYTVFRLRAKLGEPAVPNHLLTAHGHGYRFVRGGDPVHGPTDAPDPGTASAVLPTRQVPLPGGVLDLARGRFDRPDSSAVALSKLEVDVLGVLVAAAGQTVPREAVIAAGWGRGSHDASLDALIRRLRVRLDDPDGTWLVTVRGRGLRLDVGPPRVRTELRDPSTPFEPRPELDRLLASTERLVTIRGTAGIGKTRLAVEAGLRWLADDPDVEVWFCDLSAASGAASLAREVARAAGILGDDPIDRIGRVLAQRGPTVLILDNFEQLVPHAPVVAGWLAAGGRTRVVATSREALGLPAERVIDLAPLAADAGCRLFADRVHGALAPTDPGLRAVVERLDGLPLAIELAAARAEDLGTQELLRRLEARLDLLVRRPERSTSHHATLRGAFDASWDLLAPAEKAAFARCAVFVGPFGRPAARAVVGGDPVTADGALDALAARSLIHPASDGRLRLLESLRDYAFEKLLLLGLRVEAESAHRAHHLAVADRAQAVASPLLALRPIRDELLAAYRRAVTPEDRVRTALALDHLLCADGPPDLALELTTAGADHATEVPPALGWDALRASAECERLQGRGDYGCARARAALALAREVDEAAIGSAERQLGLCLRTSGRPGEASEVLRRALDRFRRLGLGRWEAATLSHLARVIHDQAGLDAAAPWFDQACRALTAQSSTLTLARLHGWWGEALMDAGEALRAPPHFDRAEALSRDDPSLAPYLMMRRAEVARWHGDLDLADDLLTQTELAAARVGSTDDSEARALRGAIAIERGDLAVALTLLRSALEMPNQGVGQRSFTSTLLAIVHHLLGRLDEALDGFDASLDVARRSGFRWVPILLGHRAMALADLDRPEAAAALAEAREAALGRSHGVRMFVGLCEAVAALADARAGRLTGPDAMALVDARIADSHVPNAFGGIPAQCDPDVSLAMRILERALDLTEIR